jgi:pyruvate dehydrogenase E2 component (dihydrolipoamide acetyltransferase)
MSKKLKNLFKSTKEGTLSPKEMSGGTFTVSNLGNLGIHGFTPVLNYPQAAILGVGGLETKIKVINGEVKPYQAMHLSLTFDHMPVDGMYAANLLKEIVKNLENFSLALLK